MPVSTIDGCRSTCAGYGVGRDLREYFLLVWWISNTDRRAGASQSLGVVFIQSTRDRLRRLFSRFYANKASICRKLRSVHSVRGAVAGVSRRWEGNSSRLRETSSGGDERGAGSRGMGLLGQVRQDATHPSAPHVHHQALAGRFFRTRVHALPGSSPPESRPCLCCPQVSTHSCSFDRPLHCLVCECIRSECVLLLLECFADFVAYYLIFVSGCSTTSERDVMYLTPRLRDLAFSTDVR